MSDIIKTKAKTTTKEPLPYGGLPEYGFVRTRHLLPVLGVSRATLCRWINEGVFPKPIALGQRMKAFKVEDVRAFIDAQGAA